LANEMVVEIERFERVAAAAAAGGDGPVDELSEGVDEMR